MRINYLYFKMSFLKLFTSLKSRGNKSAEVQHVINPADISYLARHYLLKYVRNVSCKIQIHKL
jgi:hypothetical protein